MKGLIVFGTRPEAIKLSPVVLKLKKYLTVKIVSTGQHTEMLDQVLDFFKIEPDYDLKCMGKKPNLEKLHICMFKKLPEVLKKENPDFIIVQGDTLTAYTASFVGFMLKKPVFHVEAGLRSFKKYSPCPEEMLRVLISKLADFHFAPTEMATENLFFEGIKKDRILLTGNTVVDALMLAVKLIEDPAVFKELSIYDSEITEKVHDKKLVLITVHRRENIGRPLKNICKAIHLLSQKYSDALFIWPVHKNPDVRDIVFKYFKNRAKNLVLTDPLSYQTTIYLLKKSHLVMTDSGGIQEEATVFGKPEIILRETTERPEVVSTGFGFLVGSNTDNILKVFHRLYEDEKLREYISNLPDIFGDGKASERIMQFLTSDKVISFIKNYPISAEESLDYNITEFKASL